MKRIILCADDYGQNPGISQAIINLVKKQRLSAVSCLTTSPYWSESVLDLRIFQNKIDIGLHFNLTEGVPLSPLFKKKYGDHFMSLGTLLRKAFFRELDKKIIESECHAQIDQFATKLNRLPNFIDGHQHVHQFPVIRDAIFSVYEARFRSENKAYLRCTDHWRSLFQWNKKMIIQLSGAAQFKRDVIRKQIPHNTSFSGIYSFHGNYENIFPIFLKEIGDGGLIMCHPGLVSFNNSDAISQAREKEYHYFMGASFQAACRAAQVEIR